jgi:hypothetical protein
MTPFAGTIFSPAKGSKNSSWSLSFRLCDGVSGVELFPNLAGNRAGPTGADLAHVDQFFAFPLPEAQRCNAGGIFHEADDRELALLNGFDFQPGFGSLRTIRRISPFGNDALKV